MKKKFKLVLTLGFFLNLTLISPAQPPSSNWTLIPENSDEFNGLSLDMTKWKSRVGYQTSGVFAFSPENIVVSNGYLRLLAKKEDYKGKSYTSAFLESEFNDPGNGSYIEVRAKTIDVRANICCAIWEQTFPLLPTLNPNPEIDIQEYLLGGANGNPNRIQSTLHRWYRPRGKDHHSVDAYQTYDALVPLCYDYHTYGLERRDGKLRFYIDGFKYWEYNVESMPEYVTMPRHIILSLEGHAGNPVDYYLPAVFRIDYVRLYKYNGESRGTNQ